MEGHGSAGVTYARTGKPVQTEGWGDKGLLKTAVRRSDRTAGEDTHCDGLFTRLSDRLTTAEHRESTEAEQREAGGFGDDEVLVAGELVEVDT